MSTYLNNKWNGIHTVSYFRTSNSVSAADAVNG
jgi:hypothetical protein